MKKTLILLMVIFLMVACGKSKTTTTTSQTTKHTTTTTTSQTTKHTTTTTTTMTTTTTTGINPVIYNSEYFNTFEVKNLFVNGKNIIRKDNFLVYYDNINSHQTNQYGFEVLVVDGIIVEKNINVKLVENSYVLSGHGDLANELKNNIFENDFVEIINDRAIFKRYRINHFMKQANDFLDVIYSFINTAEDNFYDYDYNATQQLVNNAENKYQAIMDKYNVVFKSNTVNEVDNNCNKIKEYLASLEKITEDIKFKTMKSEKLELRAIWHRPKENNTNEVINFLKQVKEMKINTLFLETFYHGRTVGKSEYINTHPSVSNNTYVGYNDYLECIISEAKKLNIEVHSWNHITYVGSVNLPIASWAKDEWLIENEDGNKLHPNSYGGSYYVDPSNPEVVQMLTNILTEQVEKYDLKGIQLDYIRYDVENSGYGEISEQNFSNATGITGNIKEKIKSDSNVRKQWNQWRTNNITNLVKSISESVNKANPKVIISASVMNDSKQALDSYMQDWENWVNNGYVDMINPMIYSGNCDYVKSETGRIFNLLDNKNFLVSGISCLYHGQSILNNQTQIYYVNQANSYGVAMFASQYIIGRDDVKNRMIESTNRIDAVSIFEEENVVVEDYYLYLKNKYKKGLLDRNKVTTEQYGKICNYIDGILKYENTADLKSKINNTSELYKSFDQKIINLFQTDANRFLLWLEINNNIR